jgi:two-component system sensor histidine kinase KdpD
VVGALLAGTTVLVAVLEGLVGIDNAAMAYLLAVMAAAAWLGTAAAVAAAVGAFLIYDVVFIEPRFTLTVSDSREWLALLLLLVVGTVVAWLASQLRDRARVATARQAEANALYQVSRVLATRADVHSVVPELERILARESGSLKVAIQLGTGGPGGRTAEAVGAPLWAAGSRGALRRRADGGAEWVRLHQSVITRRADSDVVAWKVPIEVAGGPLGSIWLLRPRAAGSPDAAVTRLIGVAADQIGQAMEQERLGAEARDVEITRQSEAFKSALLDSVSHDLRTPLASIRAAAGTLLDPELELTPSERRASAVAIDHEAEHLARLVTNLLDMSRIEGGALATDLEVYEIDDLVDRSLERLSPRFAGRPITRENADGLPPVRADAVLFDQVMTNLVENAIKYTPADAAVRIAATHGDGMVRVTVEDGGRGVPASALGHLFEKFYRVRTPGEGSRPGSGIGLAVVRGLMEAMGGSVRARRSQLGGLAVDLLLPAVPPLAMESGVGTDGDGAQEGAA